MKDIASELLARSDGALDEAVISGALQEIDHGKKLSNLTAALLETAKDLHGADLLSEGIFQKITLRHLGPEAPLAPPARSCGIPFVNW